MIVRSLSEIEDTERDIKTPNWRSKRIVLAKEGVGFSVHETTLYAGTVNDFWYANHIEAVFVVEGEGEITNKETGETFPLAPGSLYLLDGHEHHQVRPRTDIRTVCVFNPPVTGREVHDENGVYPLIVEKAEQDEQAPAKAANVE
ncbi:L-ectoine synthase [Actinoalloteichus sp. AHMU CJ021]|uniref:L-ectoine synthase n=1 Tax=Actinoalloteichus caeruleus DSM 43889 TaxID=1120930 RepID=A0ABT1JJC3_ACTCY|nr:MULTISPECIES: ectoine synthase [Actinoalloteichus]AUS78512.1 L-ectoine synthase [Actinoalloteichus sp. AHMU CJ021]MCP2332619.1 L-ectoine synthase [Actinoalloteichus caeruleus DSM 43889]